jgi:4'-phosphopantetheinyl transferase
VSQAPWLLESFEPVARRAVSAWMVSWPSGPIERCLGALSMDERARAGRFAFERDRHCYIVTRGVLRALLACQLAADAASLKFAYDAFGKPSLSGLWTGLVDFNVSHSAGASVVALSRVGPVGVDIERVRPVEDRDRLADRTFAAAESVAIRNVASGDRDRAFFTCWTRKEAFVKATGQGLSYPLHEFIVSVDADAPSPLLEVQGDRFEARHWTLRDLPAFERCVSALAVRAVPTAINVHRLRELGIENASRSAIETFAS